MHSLVGYGSDDDLDESPPPRKSAWQLGNQIGFQSQTCLRSVHPSQADVNYEEVQMELSEDSNDSDVGCQFKGLKKTEESRSKTFSNNDKEERRGKYKEDRDRDKRNKDEDRDRFRDDRNRDDDKDRYKADRYDNSNRDRSRGDRDDDSGRERYKGDKDNKYRDREREHRYREDKGRDDKNRSRDDEDKYRDRDRDRGRDYRDKYKGRRSSSKDKDRGSRSPRRSDYRKRSRSGSRDRSGKSGYPRKFDRGSSRIGRIEKLGIDIKGSALNQPEQQEQTDTNNRFFMPGITGRFTEQIQRRKMLWQKNKEPEKVELPPNNFKQHTSVSAAPAASSSNQKTGKLWETTTFAQDQDGKVANKFKRLMGIRDNSADGIKPTSELIKKQEEMFTSMEAQYEVARTATHTMRGVGLGFGSFQR